MRHLLLPLGALFALAGCLPPLTATAQPLGRVTFGDSNVAKLAGRLPGTVFATPGFSLDDWFAEMGHVAPGVTVIVALGSNDILEDDTAGDVAEAARLLERRCVVWVTPAQSSFDALGEPYATRAAELIAEISAQAHVVVWDTTLFQPGDPVHLTAEGYDDYTEALTGAVCP